MSGSDKPEQIKLMERMVDLSIIRTELSAESSYQNAERTLSVWIRTALSLMIFGIAIDRFGLLLRQLPSGAELKWLYSSDLSTGSGIVLVALGVLMVVTAGLRFVVYALAFKRQYPLPRYHGPYLAPFYALMVALFGGALFVVLLVFAMGA